MSLPKKYKSKYNFSYTIKHINFRIQPPYRMPIRPSSEAYFTPDRLATIFPGQSPLCWRNCGSVGFISHVWRHCPIINNFWSAVFLLASSIIGVALKPVPKLVLLGIGLDSWPFKFHTVLTHVVIAARLTLAGNGKQATPPECLTTIRILNEHALFEYTFAKTNLLQEKCLLNWSLWILSSCCTLPLS